MGADLGALYDVAAVQASCVPLWDFAEVRMRRPEWGLVARNTDHDLPWSLSQARDFGPFTTQSIMPHAPEQQERHQLVYSFIFFWCKIIRNYHLSGSTEVQIKRYTQPQADDDPSERSPPPSSYSNTLYICCLPARQTLLTPYTTSNTAAPARLRKRAPVPPTR